MASEKGTMCKPGKSCSTTTHFWQIRKTVTLSGVQWVILLPLAYHVVLVLHYYQPYRPLTLPIFLLSSPQIIQLDYTT